MAYWGRMMQDAAAMSIAPSAVPQDRLREVMLSAAAGALALMPLAMWLASRSAPLFLALAAVFALVAWVRECALTGRSPLPAMPSLRALGQGGPAVVMLAIFLAFALLSIAWSHDRPASLRAFGELMIPILSGLVVALILPGRAPRWAGWALCGALGLAVVLTLFELNGQNLWRLRHGLRAQTFIFNRTLITALLLALPLAAWLILRGRNGLAIALMVLVGSGLMASDSGAGKLGLAVAAAGACAAMIAPRLAAAAAAAGLVALIALAPVKGEILDQIIPPSAHQALQDAHSRDRVHIWQSFGEAVRARPLLGAGFGTSATLHRAPVADDVAPARRTMLGAGHPHSLPVQLWAETGLIGALLLLGAGLAGLVAIARLPGRWRIAAFALFAGALAIAAVGHGAWQGWWIAALAAAIGWLRIFRLMPSGGWP